MQQFLTIFGRSSRLTSLMFGMAAGIMAYHPLRWLVGTWQDPSYDSQGLLIFLCTVAVFCWSASSNRHGLQPVPVKQAFLLLVITMLVRFLGQVFAVNIIGALALVVDVYALALLAGLHLRQRPVSPFWLAVCFAFSLPLERIVQRLSGYGLQHLSAEGACLLLGNMLDSVTCHGVRIAIDGQDVLVDLPCSGARNLLLLCFFFAMCAAFCRPSWRQAFTGVGLTLAVGIFGNMLRIILLATGLHLAPWGIAVMQEPWHSLIGLVTLSLAILPVLWWAQRSYQPVGRRSQLVEEIRYGTPRGLVQEGWWLLPQRPPVYARYAVATGFLLLALVVVNLPRQAVDVVKRDLTVTLPERLGVEQAIPISLLPKEHAYFTQYGGAAAKAFYGEQTLMVVKTSAPLRHLHAPDACLRGLGFKVSYQGMRYTPMPTSIYRATSPDGDDWQIAVTFIDEQGNMTSNVSEAIWHWLQHPGSVWSAIQRITPWERRDGQAFDHAVMAAFDLYDPLKISIRHRPTPPPDLPDVTPKGGSGREVGKNQSGFANNIINL